MTLVAVLALGCRHLGPPRVEYGPEVSLPIVHPSNDANRWYVVVDTGTFGERVFFLDTGYSYTTCDDDFARELGLETRGRIVVHGEAGNVIAERTRLPDFRIGEHEIHGLSCLVRDLDTTSSIDDPPEVAVAGVLGADVIHPFRATLDPTVPRLRLQNPRTVERIDRDDPNVVRVRREYVVGLRFTIPLQVGADDVRLVVDTGASGSHVDGADLGLLPSFVREDVPVRASGATGGEMRDLVYYTIPEVGIGDHAFGPVTLTDRDRGRWVPGLLGLNVLRYYRVELDLRRGLARFEPIEPAPVPSWRDHAASDGDEDATVTSP